MSNRCDRGERSASSLLAFLLLASGCGAAPPAASPAKTAASTAPPPLASSAEPQAPEASAAPSAASDPPAPTEPLPPITRPLVAVVLLKTKAGVVHVPDGKPMPPAWVGLPQAEIISVHGRSPRDIWLLTEDQTVLHDDGKRIVDRHMRPCGWGEFNHELNAVGTRFLQIVADKDSVRVLGESRGPNTRIGEDVTATLTRGGKWSCGGHGLVSAVTTSSGDHTWKLAHNFDSDPCRLRLLGGPCAPAPSFAPSFSEPIGDAIDMGIHFVALWMRGLDDGWIVTVDHDGREWLHRFNGASWSPVARLDKDMWITDLWADDEAHVWLPVRRGGNWGDPATLVLRFDGKALRPLPVPASFATRLVRGTSARDVWFAGGGGKVYQWDGTQLRQGLVAFEPTDAWSSLGGEVWIVGKEGVAHTAPLPEAR